MSDIIYIYVPGQGWVAKHPMFRGPVCKDRLGRFWIPEFRRPRKVDDYYSEPHFCIASGTRNDWIDQDGFPLWSEVVRHVGNYGWANSHFSDLRGAKRKYITLVPA